MLGERDGALLARYERRARRAFTTDANSRTTRAPLAKCLTPPSKKAHILPHSLKGFVMRTRRTLYIFALLLCFALSSFTSRVSAQTPTTKTFRPARTRALDARRPDS